MQFTIEDIKTKFELDGRGYKLRDWNSFTKVRDKHHLVCSKHSANDWYASIHPILSARRLGCPICKAEAASLRYRADTNNIIGRLSEKGFALVGEYRNMHHLTECTCQVCGTTSKMKITNILHANQGCYNCNGTKPLTSKEVIDRLAGFNLRLLNVYSGFSKDKHDLLCTKCGYIRTVALVGPLNKGGCPSCSKYGFSKQKKATLYYVYGSVSDAEYFKIGITNRSVIARNKQTFDNVKIIWSYESTGVVIYELEQKLLKQFNHLIQTDHTFSGSTECFTEDIRKYVDLDKFISDNT